MKKILTVLIILLFNCGTVQKKQSPAPLPKPEKPKPTVVKPPAKMTFTFYQEIKIPPIFFKFDSTKIAKNCLPGKTCKQWLEEITLGLKEVQDEIYEVRIDGHTDKKGTYQYNVELSRQRAEKILWHFINAGINPSKLKIGWWGYNKPEKELAKTKQEHQTNRRVNITIVNKITM